MCLCERIVNFPASLSEIDVRQAISDAFHVWSDVSALSFTEQSSGHADITIQFLTGLHGDGWPFDGPGESHIRPHTMLQYRRTCISGRKPKRNVLGEVEQNTQNNLYDVMYIAVARIFSAGCTFPDQQSDDLDDVF